MARVASASSAPPPKTSVEPVAEAFPCDPLFSQCRVLRRQLGEPDTPRGGGTAPAPDVWVVDYLRGIEAELRGDDAGALALYRNVLSRRPGSFWANYRAAAVAFATGRYHDAAERMTNGCGRTVTGPVVATRTACSVAGSRRSRTRGMRSSVNSSGFDGSDGSRED